MWHKSPKVGTSIPTPAVEWFKLPDFPLLRIPPPRRPTTVLPNEWHHATSCDDEVHVFTGPDGAEISPRSRCDQLDLWSFRGPTEVTDIIVSWLFFMFFMLIFMFLVVFGCSWLFFMFFITAYHCQSWEVPWYTHLDRIRPLCDVKTQTQRLWQRSFLMP